MNATMTCKTAAFKPVHIDVRAILAAIRRFVNAMLEVNEQTPFGLPADMAARLYL